MKINHAKTDFNALKAMMSRFIHAVHALLVLPAMMDSVALTLTSATR